MLRAQARPPRLAASPWVDLGLLQGTFQTLARGLRLGEPACSAAGCARLRARLRDARRRRAARRARRWPPPPAWGAGLFAQRLRPCRARHRAALHCTRRGSSSSAAARAASSWRRSWRLRRRPSRARPPPRRLSSGCSGAAPSAGCKSAGSKSATRVATWSRRPSAGPSSALGASASIRPPGARALGRVLQRLLEFALVPGRGGGRRCRTPGRRAGMQVTGQDGGLGLAPVCIVKRGQRLARTSLAARCAAIAGHGGPWPRWPHAGRAACAPRPVQRGPGRAARPAAGAARARRRQPAIGCRASMRAASVVRRVASVCCVRRGGGERLVGGEARGFAAAKPPRRPGPGAGRPRPAPPRRSSSRCAASRSGARAISACSAASALRSGGGRRRRLPRDPRLRSRASSAPRRAATRARARPAAPASRGGLLQPQALGIEFGLAGFECAAAPQRQRRPRRTGPRPPDLAAARRARRHPRPRACLLAVAKLGECGLQRVTPGGEHLDRSAPGLVEQGPALQRGLLAALAQAPRPRP